jgi:glutathione S-transferase
VKLYSLKNAPNPRRVRIFLAEKRVILPIEEIDDVETGLHRKPEFGAKNSLRQLPVLELDDGTTLTESVAICRYFEETVPEPPLFGRSTIERAQVEMWNRRMEIELLLPTIDVFVHTHPFWTGKREQMPDWGARQKAHLVERMRWLDGELKDRQFIGVDRYNIADITAQVALLTARGACGLPIPDDHKNLARWWGAVSKRPTARA